MLFYCSTTLETNEAIWNSNFLWWSRCSCRTNRPPALVCCCCCCCCLFIGWEAFNYFHPGFFLFIRASNIWIRDSVTEILKSREIKSLDGSWNKSSIKAFLLNNLIWSCWKNYSGHFSFPSWPSNTMIQVLPTTRNQCYESFTSLNIQAYKYSRI